jgi:hypothetical protein
MVLVAKIAIASTTPPTARFLNDFTSISVKDDTKNGRPCQSPKG